MVAVTDICWKVVPKCEGFEESRKLHGAVEYEDSKKALQQFLADYFTAHDDCVVGIPKSIANLGATTRGRKILKVRWLLPGGGKRGGLRLSLAVDCAKKTVYLARVGFKKDEPNGDVIDAAERADGYS